MELTVTSQIAPAGGPAGGGGVELADVTRQADGSDEVIELDGTLELQQGDVVVEQGVVEVRMDEDLGHGAPDLVGVWASLSLSSQVDDPRTRCQSDDISKNSRHRDKRVVASFIRCRQPGCKFEFLNRRKRRNYKTIHL